MTRKPLLSICIPTYNRCSYLEETIYSVVNQKRFQNTDDVEIIVSDNCSDDETTEIVSKFVQLYGNKIHYYRNNKNIQDLNFEKVLSYGNGQFLKLNNDTLKHCDESLDYMLDIILENIGIQNNLFFSNGVLGLKSNMLCHNINSFIDAVSYYSGWIACFGIWKNDFAVLNDFSRRSNLQLTQVDVLFRLINNKSILLVDMTVFVSIPLPKKGGYDFLKVFLENYILLLTEQLNVNKLSYKIFRSEKRKLLLRFIRPWLNNIKSDPDKYFFKCNNSFKKIYPFYKDDLYSLTVFLLCYNLSIFKRYIRRML
jgi:abequosyltransferase